MTDQNITQNSNPQPSQNSQPPSQQPGTVNTITIPVSNSYLMFTGSGLVWTTPTSVESKKEETKRVKREPDGCACKKCHEFYQFAEPNQEDGTLICYSCRTYG
jgi:hypothetical protein